MKRLLAVLCAAAALAIPASASALTIAPAIPVAPYGKWASADGVALAIASFGQYAISAPSFGNENGGWVASPAVKQIRFTPSGSDFCGSSGLYRWKSSGTFLRLQAISDSCSTRRMLLNNRLFSSGLFLPT